MQNMFFLYFDVNCHVFFSFEYVKKSIRCKKVQLYLDFLTNPFYFFYCTMFQQKTSDILRQFVILIKLTIQCTLDEIRAMTG